MRRVFFWLGVAGVALGANIALEFAADKTGSPGLARLAAYTHRGAS